MGKCIICGSDIVGRRSDAVYCSKKCQSRANAIKRGVCLDHGLLTKQCIVCGKEFQTFKSKKVTCSDECSKKNKGYSPYDPQKARREYLKKHPNARKQEDIIWESQEKKKIKQANYEKWLAEKEKEWEEIRAKKKKQKQENIAYWLEYEAEHECAVCRKRFIAHYPTTKYCSDKCRNKIRRRKKRYEGITVDSDISLFKLAKRDNDICQLCGLKVNWEDKIETDKTIICGDMYPSIDHIKPISLGGMHSWDNIQLAHRGCNTKKRNKFIG